MYRSILKKARAGAGAAVVAAMALGAGVAQAAEFTVNWDPTFNTTFNTSYGTNLGWKGTGHVVVDNSCALTPGVPLVVGGTCTAVMDTFSLNLYNTISLTPFATFTQADAASIPAIQRLYAKPNGDFGGVDFDLSQAQVVDGLFIQMSSPFSVGANVFDVALDFIIGATPVTDYSGPTLRLTYLSNNSLPSDFSFVSSSSAAAVVCPAVCYSSIVDDGNLPQVEWIPEPGTLALAGVAIAALGLRRRKP